MERFLYLDSTCHMVRFGWDEVYGLIDVVVADASGDDKTERQLPIKPGFATALLTALVDWDEVLRLGNEWYDRLVALPELPIHRNVLQKLFDIDWRTARVGPHTRSRPRLSQYS